MTETKVVEAKIDPIRKLAADVPEREEFHKRMPAYTSQVERTAMFNRLRKSPQELRQFFEQLLARQQRDFDAVRKAADTTDEELAALIDKMNECRAGNDADIEEG